MQLEGEAFKPCTLKNFLVLLNNVFRYVRYVICKSRNFLVLLNLANMPIGQAYLQKQKFSCVTQPSKYANWTGLSAKAEIFLCYSTNSQGKWLSHLQKQKFSCVTQLFMSTVISAMICKSRNFLVLLNDMTNFATELICKSRNFLVLLNYRKDGLFQLSAKAEIFLCYSTIITQPMRRNICKSRNFLVLLNTAAGNR